MDLWNTKFPVLKTDDLAPRDDSLPVNLSILMSVNNFRRGQLARTLETLCRQDWKEFEVLVCDNGSPENLDEVFEIFDPFLRLKTIRLERVAYSACPTRGLRALFPEASGDVWTIMQPEIMLHPNVAEYLYGAHFNDWAGTISYKIAISKVSTEGLPKWVIPKNGFLDETGQAWLDRIDWHSNIMAIESLPGFTTHTEGFSYSTNVGVFKKREWPWWFVGSALKDAGIWRDMPEFQNHASVDQWMLSYRRLHEYVDICTSSLTGYHQFHHRGQQVVPVPETIIEIPPTEEEKASWLPLEIDELRNMVGAYGIVALDDDFDALWNKLGAARAKDREVHHRTVGDRPHPLPPLPADAAMRIRRSRGGF